MHPSRILLCLLAVLGCSVVIDSSAFAQRPISEQQQRDFRRRNQKMMEEMMRKQGAQAMPQQPPEQKKEEPKPEEAKKPEDETKTVKRPTEAPKVDPNRKKLQPDADGRVQFNYFGAPWADVLQDYADAAGYSLDWQELPADYLNLTTKRKYTLKEAHDILNRHLLARGFTLVLQGEVLTAAKLDKLDPSLVPKVEPDDLEDFSPSEVVRVRYELPMTMDPAKAAEDVKILLTPNGKVTPLLATKRLLVIDAVANQRSVRDLIYSEQLSESSFLKPREFQIRYRRAEYVADQIMIVLGMDPGARKSPMELQMEQQQQQQQMQMMQQMQGQNQGQDMSKLMPKEAPKVFIAVNRPRNTLLVNAPPELMPVVERTIKMLDVGEGEPVGAEAGTLTMEKYKTVTAGADSVIKALKDIGDLDPLTQLQADEDSKMIFAYATPGDHAKIVRMIGKLDGSGRRPEVIWLPPQLPADQVAGSIMALIVGDVEKKDEDDNMPWFFRFGNQEKKKELTNEGFRVLPDVENNRLLLWASDDELAEIHNLIKKLSQNADGTIGDNRKVRRLEGRDPKEIERLLEQLKSTWQGENELEIHVAPPEKKPEEKKKPATDESESGDDKLTGVPRTKFLLAQVAVEQEKPAEDQGEKKKAPISISVNADGEMVIASDDVEALNKLQELIDQLAPGEPEYHYFKLRHVYADDVVDNLEKYFEDDMAEEGESVRDWWGRRVETKPDPGPLSLGKRRPLRFIDDLFTNTVVVANASPSQLRTIKELIVMYDKPNEPEDYFPRKTVVVRVNYSKASDIAASLKDVYRDLLSSKDKEFQDKEGKSSSTFSDSKGYVFGDVPAKAGSGRSAVVIGFAGVLSVGIDEVSNSLVICAREELVDSIVKTVHDLDEAAKPDTVVQLHEVSGLLTSERLQEALSKAMGQPWPGGKPMQVTNGQQQGQGGDNRTEANRENSAERRRGGGRQNSGGNNGSSGNNNND